MKTAIFSCEVRADVRLGVVDLTDDLARAIKDSGVTEGFAVAFCHHTTCALLINEWEDGVLRDLRDRIEALVPRAVYYAHDDLTIRTQNLQEEAERANGCAHVAQMIIGGSSHAIPIEGGEVAFGRWQRLLLLELDEPRARTISFHIYGD